MSMYVGVQDAARTVGLTASTIKKYYIEIEKNGYRFTRDNRGRLIFSGEDIEMFQRVIVLKNEPGISVEKACEIVAKEVTSLVVYKEKEEPVTTDMTDIAKSLSNLQEILMKQQELINQQQKELMELKEGQKNSNLLIEENASERDKLLMQSIREGQENKKLLLEIQSQIVATKENEKKWWQIWK